MRLSAFNQNSLYGFKVLTEFEYLQFTCTTSCKAKVRPNEGEIIKPNGAGSKIIVQWKWETGMRFAGAIHHSKGIGYIKNNRKSSSCVVTFALRFFFFHLTTQTVGETRKIENRTCFNKRHKSSVVADTVFLQLNNDCQTRLIRNLKERLLC